MIWLSPFRMGGGKSAELTEKQRECLRLVLQHRTSKEIARELGIGVDAVDQRIKGAMRRLGVTSRLDAAKLLFALERGGELQSAPAEEAMVSKRPPPRLLPRFKRLWPKDRRYRLVVLASIVAFALGGPIGYPLDCFLRDLSLPPHKHPASGTIVILAIDRHSNDVRGGPPWPRELLAQLVNRADQLGARQIFFHYYVDIRRDPQGDRALAEAFEKVTGRLFLPVGVEGDNKPIIPLPEFAKGAELVGDRIWGYLRTPRGFPYQVRVGERDYPSVPLALSGIVAPPIDKVSIQSVRDWLWGPPAHSFLIDYSIDLRSLPKVSADAVLRGLVPRNAIAGKTIIIGETDERLGWAMSAPGYGAISPTEAIALGAETIRSGAPQEFPPALIFLGAVIVAMVAARMCSAIASFLLIGGGLAAMVLAHSLFLSQKLYFQNAPGLFTLAIVGVGFSVTFIRRGLKPGSSRECGTQRS